MKVWDDIHNSLEDHTINGLINTSTNEIPLTEYYAMVTSYYNPFSLAYESQNKFPEKMQRLIMLDSSSCCER